MSISLLGSINVCKVNTGYANKIQSDRIENPDNMLCPLWNGYDTMGRAVHPDSFYTKASGCASADDRISVENFLRPQYMEYVALDAAGFQSPTLYNKKHLMEGFQNPNGNQLVRDAIATRQNGNDLRKITGNFGLQLDATNTLTDTGMNGVNGTGYLSNAPACGRRNVNVRENFDNLSTQNYHTRQALSAIQGFKSMQEHRNAGF